MSTERGTIFMVVGFIGSFTIIALLSMVWMVTSGSEPSDQVYGGLFTLIGTGLGALGSMLVRTSSSSDTQDVSVVNPPSDPVPTEEASAVATRSAGRRGSAPRA